MEFLEEIKRKEAVDAAYRIANIICSDYKIWQSQIQDLLDDLEKIEVQNEDPIAILVGGLIKRTIKDMEV